MQAKKEAVKPIGIVDAISLGYRVLGRRWPVVLIPLVVDLFLWLGPQISPWGVIKNLLAEAPDPKLATMLQQALGLESMDVSTLTSGPNLLSLVAAVPGSPPTLVGTLGFLPAPAGWERLTWVPGSPWTLLGLIVILLVVGVPVAATYLVSLARVFWTAHPDLPRVERPWLWTTGNLMLLVALGIVISFGLSLGLTLTVVLLSLANNGLALSLFSVGMMFLSWLVLWALLLFYFAPVSMVLQRTHVLTALWRSANVVMRNFWSALGFLALTFLISRGFALIWQRLASTLPGVLVGMVGNAYLGTGLALAAFVFFQDRYHHWCVAMSEEVADENERNT